MTTDEYPTKESSEKLFKLLYDNGMEKEVDIILNTSFRAVILEAIAIGHKSVKDIVKYCRDIVKIEPNLDFYLTAGQILEYVQRKQKEINLTH